MSERNRRDETAALQMMLPDGAGRCLVYRQCTLARHHTEGHVFTPRPSEVPPPAAHPVGACFADIADMNVEWTFCPFCGGTLHFAATRPDRGAGA